MHRWSNAVGLSPRAASPGSPRRMARIHLVHWDPADGRAQCASLATLGHDVAFRPSVTGTPLMRALRGGAPDAFLIDLSRRPSHGREVTMALRTSRATRHIPVLFAGGDAEATARMRQLPPDAEFTTWGRVKIALPRVIRLAPRAPVVPPARSMPVARSHRNLASPRANGWRSWARPQALRRCWLRYPRGPAWRPTPAPGHSASSGS